MGVLGLSFRTFTPTLTPTPALPLTKGRGWKMLGLLGIFKESFERKHEFADWRNGNFVIEYRFRAITFDFT